MRRNRKLSQKGLVPTWLVRCIPLESFKFHTFYSIFNPPSCFAAKYLECCRHEISSIDRVEATILGSGRRVRWLDQLWIDHIMEHRDWTKRRWKPTGKLNLAVGLKTLGAYDHENVGYASPQIVHYSNGRCTVILMFSATAAIKGHSATLQNSKNRKLKCILRVFLTPRILHLYIWSI